MEKLPEVRVGGLNVTAVARESVEQVADNDIPGLAAEMAYHSTLAVFPFLLFLAGLTAVLHSVFGIENFTDRMAEQVGSTLSEDAANVVETLVQEVRQSRGLGALVFGLIGTLWAASAVIGTAMKGLNRIYDRQEDRRMVARKLQAIGLAIVFCGLLVTAAVLIGAGELIAQRVGDRLRMGAELESVVEVLMWPLSVALVVVAVALLYWLGPSGENRFRWITPGAAVFAAGWVVASLVFSVYIANLGQYNATYGSLGVMIIVLVWMYWTNLLLLLGAQVNCIIRNVHDGGNGEISAQPKSSQAQP